MSSHSAVDVSIRNSLLNLARNTNRQFNELVQYYAMERFLYRLSLSDCRDRFILKGALLFHVWDISESRATRDIDLLGMAENSTDYMKNLVSNICDINIDCEDGIIFEASTMIAEVMQVQREYEGIRIKFKARLIGEKNLIPMQIDIGFGDLVTPKPESITFPTLLDFPSPVLTGYPVETVIAEKLHTMVEKDSLNSRIKDYHDVWLLLRWGQFDKETLMQAVDRTFEQRGMNLNWKKVFQVIAHYGNSTNAQNFWESYRKKVGYPTSSQNISEICTDINVHLDQLCDLHQSLVDVLCQNNAQEFFQNDRIKDYFLRKLNAGEDVKKASKTGHGILQLVIKHKKINPPVKLALVKLLIEFGADVNSSDKSSLTPFQSAIVVGDKKIADFLLFSGAKKLVPPGTGYAKYYNMYLSLPLP